MPDFNITKYIRVSATLAILLLTTTRANAQQELEVLHKWMQYTDAPNSLYRHLTREAAGYLVQRTKTVAGLKTLAAWQQRQQWIKRTLQEAVGAFPAKTPLHAKITNTLQKDDYRVEHIVYESQPRFYVTGSLFVPGNLPEGVKAPAILYCSGHAATGYRSAAYQRVIINLVKKGFVVFAFDPVGQGERMEYIDSLSGKSRHKWPSNEHSYPGAQVFLTGNTLAMHMIWDGIRAVDYLLTRKEVDPQRIGITGRSGGGTQCAYIAAFDNRIKVSAPENYITNFTRLFQTIGPQDAEQNFFHGIAKGLDMGDLLMVRAPQPSLMITTTRDIFSIQGATETASEVATLYQTYGRQGNFRMVTDDAAHASTLKNREAMYAFFRQHLQHPGDTTDENITPLREEELYVGAPENGATIFSLNLAAAREKRAAQAENKQPEETVRRISGYRTPLSVQAPVLTGRIQKEGYVIEKAFIAGEGDYVIPYLLLKPERPNQKAILCLLPAGKSSVVQMDWLVKQGYTLLAPDLVGTGETGPGSFMGDSFIDSVSYNLWFAAVQTGRSITGIQAADVNRLALMLQKNNHMQAVYGLSLQEMAPVLLHAATFNQTIQRIALIQPYSSWWSIVSNRIYRPAFIHSAVPGAIGKYDLPDLAAGLAPRRLLIAGVTDGNGQPLPESTAELTAVRKGYQRTTGQLQITAAAPLQQLLTSWLQD